MQDAQWRAQRADPPPNGIAVPAGFKDPSAHQRGLRLYERTLSEIARIAKYTPILFDGIPPFSPFQWQQFRENRRLWRDAQTYWHRPDRQDALFKSLRARLGPEQKPALRNIVLRNGYIFTIDRLLAKRIYKTWHIEELFDESRVFLQRGDRLLTLERKDGTYVYADGPEHGEPATILLFDRFALQPDLLSPVWHWDLEGLRFALGLHHLEIKSQYGDHLDAVAQFATGQQLPATVVRVQGRSALILRGLEPRQWDPLVRKNRRWLRARLRVLATAETFIAEHIKFDEPDNELGQQDGVLRFAWIRAYENGRDFYHFNGMKYSVFDDQGRPQPPQVCVDFLTDSIERASGSWWSRRGASRQKTHGRLNWQDFPRFNPRSVPSLQHLVRRQPDKFEGYTVAEAQRIPYRQQERFYRQLAHFPVDFQEADIVVIFGKREDEKNHYHSFFVYRIDPIHAVPLLAADNAGMARTRPLDDVLRKTPRRFLHRRIRLRPEWLLQLGLDETLPNPVGRDAVADWLLGGL